MTGALKPVIQVECIDDPEVIRVKRIDDAGVARGNPGGSFKRIFRQVTRASNTTYPTGQRKERDVWKRKEI